MKKKPINVREKGATGEREVAKLIKKSLGVSLVRNLEQTRNGGHDLMPEVDTGCAICQFAIEVKRYNRVTDGKVKTWWEQTTSQADNVDKKPCLIYRGDNEPWRVMINSELQPFITIQVTMSFEGFVAYMHVLNYKNADFKPLDLEYQKAIDVNFWKLL